jgi:uncharacterized repeat protein (TIGR02543 family)
LRNSWIPREIPSVSLVLDNSETVAAGRTEFDLFISWFERTLRYGTIPFRIPRLGMSQGRDVGIYAFVPDSVRYDEFKSPVKITFSLKEIFIESHNLLVNFDRNNRDPGATDAIPDSIYFEYRNMDMILPIPPVRRNYTFLGWNTHMDGSGEYFDESFPVDRNMTVFAMWSGTFLVRKIQEAGLDKLIRLGSTDEVIRFAKGQGE